MQTAAKHVASGVNNFVESFINILRTRLRHDMQELDLEVSERTFSKLFDIELPFNGVVTAHERKTVIKKFVLL